MNHADDFQSAVSASENHQMRLIGMQAQGWAEIVAQAGDFGMIRKQGEKLVQAVQIIFGLGLAPI